MWFHMQLYIVALFCGPLPLMHLSSSVRTPVLDNF